MVLVRFQVDISHGGDDDRVSGHVAREGEAAVPFSGWLELLRLLEDRAVTVLDDARSGNQP